MTKLVELPIRLQLLLMVALIALFTFSLIVFSGIQQRAKEITHAKQQAKSLAALVEVQQQSLVTSAEQLLHALDSMPEVHGRNATRVEAALAEAVRLNPQYTTIFITDRSGAIWASALPVRGKAIADRESFTRALSLGHFTAGRYKQGQYSGKQVLSFYYPYKNSAGEITGVIILGIDLGFHKKLMENITWPNRTSYVLLDHEGVVLGMGFDKFIGQRFDEKVINRMRNGPMEDTEIGITHDGLKRITAYRKLTLKGESEPYMYVRVGIPFDLVMAQANRTFLRNLVLTLMMFSLVLYVTWIIGKHSIADRISLLKLHSGRLAEGAVTGKVSDLIKGGELGELALTVDRMVEGITSREEALRQSEYRYRTLFEQSPDGIVIVDLSGSIVHFNDVACCQLGYTREEFSRLSIADLDPDETPSDVRKRTEKILETGGAAFDVRHLTKRGEIRYHHVITQPIDLAGETVMYAIWQDITDRKRSEDALKQSEQFIRNILDTVDEGFIVVDRDYRILTANRAYCSQVGACDAELIGRHCYEISHKTDRPCFEEGEVCAARHAFETGTPHTAIHRHKDAHGHVLYVETKAFPIKDASGTVTSVIEIINNITEKYLLEEERLKTQKLESIGTLAGGIAHDFNNLLQGVFGYISMAKVTHDRKEKSLAMLNQAEEALHMAVNLTTQLLTFSKGGKPLKKLIRLEPAIENAVKFALSGSHTHYRLDIASDLRAVQADAGQLAQVIQNIVLNANDAMAGRGTITISVRNIDIPPRSNPGLPDGGQFVRIDIQDTGTGISEQNKTKIFDPYFTTKQKGSGLGLATSYSIIKNHGGVIEVSSELSRGSTFTIYLPASIKTEAETAAAPPTAAGTKKGRVLLMDDEDVVRDVAKEMIAALGHEVAGAEDGRKAIELFRQAREEGRPFDLVILDLTVKGGMGGEEAIAKIREIDPAVRAVVSSGYADSPVVADYRAYGYEAVLKKPYKLESLRDCLQQFFS